MKEGTIPGFRSALELESRSEYRDDEDDGDNEEAYESHAETAASMDDMGQEFSALSISSEHDTICGL